MNCNGLTANDTIQDATKREGYVALEVSPVRDSIALCTHQTAFVLCSPEDRKIWSVYGIDALGFANLIHDCHDDEKAGPAIQWLHDVTKLPVRFYSDRHRATRDMTTLEMAEWLTEQIHDEIPGVDDAADFRDDDFENHALAPLRESLCCACGYNGDPVQHPEGEAA